MIFPNRLVDVIAADVFLSCQPIRGVHVVQTQSVAAEIIGDIRQITLPYFSKPPI